MKNDPFQLPPWEERRLKRVFITDLGLAFVVGVLYWALLAFEIF